MEQTKKTQKKIPEIKFVKSTSQESHEAKSTVMREAGYEPWACHFKPNGEILIVYRRTHTTVKSEYVSFVD